MSRILPLILASATLGQGVRHPPEIPRTAAAVLEALRGRDEAAKLAAVAILDEELRADRRLERMFLEYQSGASPLAMRPGFRLQSLGLDVDQISLPLVSCLNAEDPGLRDRSVSALRCLRLPLLLPVLPEMLALLGDARPEVKLKVIDLLAHLGPYYPDERIPAALLERWRNAHPDVRARARLALRDVIPWAGNDGSDRVPDVPSLVVPLGRFLADGDSQTRIAALGCLAAIGTPARAIRAEVPPFLRDSDLETRFKAACAILTIDGRRKTPEAETARGVFLDLVGRYHPDFFRGRGQLPDLPSYEQAIRALGPRAAAPVLGALAEERRRPNYINESKIQTLGRLGPDGREAISGLKAFLDQPDWHVRCTAATAIASIDRSDPDLIRHMIAAIRGPEPAERDHAVWVLGRCGPPAKSAIPILEGQLADPRYRQSPWRVAVVSALARIEPGHPRAVRALIETLRPGCTRDSWYAVETLGEQGQRARDAIPLLRQVAEVGRDFDPIWCHEALFRIDPDQRDSLRALTRALDSADGQTRLYAMASLGRIGTRAGEALPRLTRLSLDRSRLIREAAVAAIGSIEGRP